MRGEDRTILLYTLRESFAGARGRGSRKPTRSAAFARSWYTRPLASGMLPRAGQSVGSVGIEEVR